MGIVVKVFRIFKISDNISLPLHNEVIGSKKTYYDNASIGDLIIYDGKHLHIKHWVDDNKHTYARLMIDLEFIEANISNNIFTEI